MSVGYAVSKLDLDNRMGTLVSALRTNLNDVAQFKVLLDDTTLYPDSVLLSAPFNYQQAEIDTFRAAFTALAKLEAIARGAATQATPDDFWFYAKHLTGITTA